MRQQKIFFESSIIHAVNSSDNIENINIFHQNVCGITNKKDEFEIYLDSLGRELHYICLTEHFLYKHSAPLFQLENYNLVSYNFRSNKKEEDHS